MTTSDISQELGEWFSDLIEIRRHLHAHPELSGEEHQTAALVAGELRKFGWQVKEGVGRTGVIADLGETNGPLVGFRVDMDALPIEEKTNLPFSSLRQGVMHACGHDLHTCIGLGVAKLLAQDRSHLTGVRLLFQPAEEIASGARWMKKDGAIRGVDALFGVHVFPELPSGFIGVKSGILTAAAGELEINVLGNGGHGARPHETTDAIWIAAKIISGLQESISRRLDALSPVVVSFGKIQGGSTFNVIAHQVKLLGTVRYLDSKLNTTLPAWIKQTIQDIARSFGADVQIKYRCIAPPIYNDPQLTELLENSAISLLGTEKVVRLENPSLGAEDFAEYLQEIPGTMFRLGIAGEEGCAPLHNGLFSLDEASLAVGIKVVAKTLTEWMKSSSKFF